MSLLSKSLEPVVAMHNNDRVICSCDLSINLVIYIYLIQEAFSLPYGLYYGGEEWMALMEDGVGHGHDIIDNVVTYSNEWFSAIQTAHLTKRLRSLVS